GHLGLEDRSVVPPRSSGHLLCSFLSWSSLPPKRLSSFPRPALNYRIEGEGGEPYPITEGEVKILFPDYYLNIYQTTLEKGQPTVPGIMLQKGREFTTIELVFGSKVESATIKHYYNLPPIRGEHFYMTGLMFFGNGAFAYGVNSFLEKGNAKVTGKEVIDGAECSRIKATSNIPEGSETEIILDDSLAFPKRIKEKSFDGTLVTSIYNLKVNPMLRMEDFNIDIPKLFEIDSSSCKEEFVDYGCIEISLDQAESLAGFKPICPEIKGYQLQGVYWTDPKALYGSDSDKDNPALYSYYKECYLIYRNTKGNKQIEICEGKEYNGYDDSAGATGLVLEGDPISTSCINEQVESSIGTIYISTHIGTIKAGARKGDIKIKIAGDIKRQELVEALDNMLE
ncbi:MAG: hypothetical protein AB1384_09820, partial [Actinomycetota bacterium]